MVKVKVMVKVRVMVVFTIINGESMQPEIYHGNMFIVDTEVGTEIVPFSVTNDASSVDMYVEGFDIKEINVKDGYAARLTMPGYLDCTSWIGPFTTEDEAIKSLKELYDLD